MKVNKLEKLLDSLEGEEKEVAKTAELTYIQSEGYQLNKPWIRDKMTLDYVEHNLNSYRHFNRFDREHYLAKDIVKR